MNILWEHVFVSSLGDSSIYPSACFVLLFELFLGNLLLHITSKKRQTNKHPSTGDNISVNFPPLQPIIPPARLAPDTSQIQLSIVFPLSFCIDFLPTSLGQAWVPANQIFGEGQVLLIIQLFFETFTFICSSTSSPACCPCSYIVTPVTEHPWTSVPRVFLSLSGGVPSLVLQMC